MPAPWKIELRIKDDIPWQSGEPSLIVRPWEIKRLKLLREIEFDPVDLVFPKSLTGQSLQSLQPEEKRSAFGPREIEQFIRFEIKTLPHGPSEQATAWVHPFSQFLRTSKLPFSYTL